MKVKILLFGLISLFLLFVVSPILAQARIYPTPSMVTPSPIEYALPYPGILPDHPLYFLKVVRDRLLLFFTQDGIKKIHLNLLFADKRLGAGQALFEQGNIELAIDTITKGEKYLLTTAVSSVSFKKQNLPPGLTDKIELSAKKHEEVINLLILKVDDTGTKQRLTDALGLTHQAVLQIAQFKQK